MPGDVNNRFEDETMTERGNADRDRRDARRENEIPLPAQRLYDRTDREAIRSERKSYRRPRQRKSTEADLEDLIREREEQRQKAEAKGKEKDHPEEENQTQSGDSDSPAPLDQD
jgi:hypothetical protein